VNRHRLASRGKFPAEFVIDLRSVLPRPSIILEGPFGSRLEGIVLFGSRARGQATVSSDTDLLLCLAPRTPLTRSLYSEWDRLAKTHPEALPVDLSPHFARLPGSPEEAGYLWLEIAGDGIVLWERNGSVSRFLESARRYVASGRAVRGQSGGVSCWVRNDADLASAGDLIRRSEVRLIAVDALYKARSWADVVRESQEVVELALKGLLRLARVDAPRVHDAGQALLDNRERMPEVVQPHLAKLAEHSRSLRRDRELSFYGSEDLTPTEFYQIGRAHV
jgi:HEPN domain-containing protein/predicted nucleotidyltransferase